MKKHQPITGQPNIVDDDPVNRGVSGQCLYSKEMAYDPADGKPNMATMQVNNDPVNGTTYPPEMMDDD